MPRNTSHHRPARTTLAFALLAAACGAASAQWVMLARHAIGRVEQMQQASQPGAGSAGAAYDVATVIVEVEPDKVFSVVQQRLNRNTEVKVTRTDAAQRSVEFTDGRQIGGIQVSALGDKLSQLLISTAHPASAGPVTSTLVDRILDVCKALGVACERSAGR